MKMRYLSLATLILAASLNAGEVRQLVANAAGVSWTNTTIATGQVCRVLTARSGADSGFCAAIVGGNVLPYIQAGDVFLGPCILGAQAGTQLETFSTTTLVISVESAGTNAVVQASGDLVRWTNVATVNLPATSGTNTFYRLKLN